MTDLDIPALAAQIEQRCSTLENEIATLRKQKNNITSQIKAKQEELDIAKSMRPRKRKTQVATPDQPTQ